MSIKAKLYNQKAEAAGEIELSEKVFGVKANPALVHQAFVAQRANERQVLAHTLTRANVRGGGKKPWRQKGTGRARAGSSRSPVWVGGGIVFGPTNDRNFKQKLNRKMRQKALAMVISDRLDTGRLVLLDKIEPAEYKTKPCLAMVKAWEGAMKPLPKAARRSLLVVNDEKSDQAKYSFRNLRGLTFINLENINIIDLLNHRDLVLTRGAADQLAKHIAKASSAKAMEAK
jgi:large subunit ribosomal protein L4